MGAAPRAGFDIPACDPDDPDFGTNCEDGGDDAEVRDAYLDARQIPGDVASAGDLDAAARQAAAMPEDVRDLVRPDWSLVGPSNVGGRVTDIAPDMTQPGVVYVAVATSGLWRSTDGGVSMVKSWPDTFPQALGAVAVAPNGDVWVGTGEVNPGGGSLSYGGDGVYRSTDHGRSWRHVGLDGPGTIGAIRFDPRHRNVVYVAAGGSLFTPGGTRGLYKSTDYGRTWRRVLAGVDGFTGATDIAMDPSNPDRLFVPMWDHHREALCRCYTGPGTGLYLTTDGGASWTRLGNDRITSFTPGDTIGFAASNSTTTTAQARIAVAFSPNNPQRVYVTTGNWSQAEAGAGQTQRGFRGFYRSDDSGATFQTMSNAAPGGDTVWTSKIWVDPQNADRLFIAGVNLRTSTDGGQTWATVAGLHADHHAMAWAPAAGRVFEGNDGGFYWSTGNAAGGTWTEATNEPWTQFYTVGASEQDPNRLVGGAQDNGCLRSWNSAGQVTGAWGSYGGCGDGLYTVIDPSNQNNVYACSQFGNCSRSVDAGNNSASFTNATTADRRNWETPLVLDPSLPSTVYYGGNVLNRSTDLAVNFTAISPSLSNPASNTDPAYPFGTLTAVGVAKTDPQVVYAGTDDGWLWGTRDAGATWTRFTDPSLPSRWVTRVTVDPTDARVAYVTYSGLRNGDNTAHVLRTPDAGAHWVDISGNLPAAPTQDVIIDPRNRNRIFVASDLGVFTADVTLARQPHPLVIWFRLGRGLPRVPVNDIDYQASTNTILAATYGRSIWRIQLR
ncbi:MAG TPA: glycosyl hydrolase [Rugosimonospora sp.]|nr:glycosyl hydrolase [Rugosimonospora sp.]